MKFLNDIDGAKRVKQDSSNRLVTDEQIANWNSKGVVNIGTFPSQEALIMYAIMKQLPTGQYSFIMSNYSYLMLLREEEYYYKGIFQDSEGSHVLFEVTKTGEITMLVETNIIYEIMNLQDFKVDTEEGKGLSTNDYTTAEKNKLSGIATGAQVNTVTSVNGQTGDIELTGDDLDYFDYEGTRRNVGSVLSGVNDAMYTFMYHIIGEDYDAQNDPTLKEILDMFMIVLGDYDIGVSPSLGEIAELVVGGGGSSDSSIVDLGTFYDQTELITHVVMNQLPTGHYTFIMEDIPSFMLLFLDSNRYYGTFQNSVSQFFCFQVSIYGEIEAVEEIDLRDLVDVRAYVDSQDALKADKTYVDSKVQTDVPVNAKFTDTVYSHPSSHPASMITESSTKRFVTDEEKANWDNVANKVDKVVGKDLSSEDYTTEEKQKLEGIEQNANHTPNLTLNELTLGGRFKLVYNDIEDSLDFEVIA